MKYFLTLLLAGGTLFSCTPADEARKTENLALVKKYLEAVETNNPTTMDSVLAEDYKGYGPSVGDSTNKRDAINNWKYNAENLYESIKYTRFQNIAVTIGEGEEAEAGDWVSSWALVTLKYKDGRGPVNAWVNATYKIEDGKIIHSHTFYNEADVLRQLGYEFLPPIE
jgi:hypothetical protein